jgi:hypothetical protein
MKTVACVLRSGGVYGPAWVRALWRGIRENLDSAELVCLTDLRFRILGVETIPLRYGWPGWWSKLELYREGLFAGPVTYVDLDSLPVGPLEDLCSLKSDYAALSDFYQPREMASGVVCFTPGKKTEELFERFLEDPAGIIKKHPGRSDHWYRKVLGKIDRVQELVPGQVVSFKSHAKNGTPPGARLVCGHGRPRFSDPSAGWAHILWKKRAK